MNEVIRCPFCASDKTHITREVGGDSLTPWYGRCMMCNAKGPRRSTEEGAREAWNTRMIVVKAGHQ